MADVEEIAVAVAADANFCRQLAVVVAGISRTATDPHRVFVLHDGYEPSMIRLVERSASPDVELSWIDARTESLGSAILPRYPVSSLFRLVVHQLLPQELDRVIYLDTDLVVRKPLRALWESDLGGALLGAVRDAVLPWAGSPMGLDWRRFGLPPDLPHFNAGTLVIPLDRWRESKVGEQAVALLSENSFWRADQCALNIVVAGDWKQLPPKWNLQSGHLDADGSLGWVVEPTEALESAINDPAIVHFNSAHFNIARWGRPWTAGCTHPKRHLWFEDLDRTAWKGWQPPTTRTGRRVRFAVRMKRAAKELMG